MEKYRDIDVPDFMKNKTKPILTKEEQKKEVDRAYLKGAFMGLATTLFMISMMLFVAIIENL